MEFSQKLVKLVANINFNHEIRRKCIGEFDMWINDQFIYKKQYYKLNLVLGTIMQFSHSCIFEERAEYICGSESLLDGREVGTWEKGIK